MVLLKMGPMGPRGLGPIKQRKEDNEGSWAGPAWLGGPRVLGRTGLAGGAKGPGPDRLGFGLGGQGSWAGPAWFLILRRTVIFRRFIFKKYHI